MNRSEEERLLEWNNETAKLYIINDIFLVIYLITGIIGNAIVIIVYCFKMKTRRDDRFFIPYLAVVDIIACTTRSSFELAMNFLPVNFRGSILCKTLWFPTNVSSFASMFLLLTISLQRYLKVCRPFGKQMTLKWKRFALVLTLILSIVLSTPLNIWNEEIPVENKTLNVTGYICDANLEGNLGIGFMVFVVCITILGLIIMFGMFVFNSLIGHTIYKQIKLERKRQQQLEHTRQQVLKQNDKAIYVTKTSKEITSSFAIVDVEESSISTDNSSDIQAGKNEINVLPKTDYKTEKKRQLASRSYSYMFMVIALAFMISYLPQFILLFVGIGDTDFWVNRTSIELTIFSLIREMNVINNIVNPFVYGFFDRHFRHETKQLLLKLKCSYCYKYSFNEADLGITKVYSSRC